MVSAVIWTPRDCDQLIVAPDLRRAYRSTLAGMGVGMGFGGSTGSAAMRVLRQMSAIMRAEEAAGGAALLYLAPYWQINTGFTGGYQRVTTWNDAFRSGATYGWSTHTAHNATQSEPSYAGNLATLTGGGESVLTFDNSTCRYEVDGTFSAKTAHTLVICEDMQALSAHAALGFDCTNRTAFALGDNVNTKWYWYDGANECRSAAFDRATGENTRGFVGDNADATYTFYRGADTDVVSKGSATVKAISGTVSLFSGLTGSFSLSSKRALVFYCSGKYPDAIGLCRTVFSYANDLAHPTAVAALNALKAIGQSEEAAGGSCFMLLPGDWTMQQPILTLVDVLTDGVVPVVSYAGHKEHHATQASESLEMWTTTLPNGKDAIYSNAGGKRYSIAGSWGASTSRNITTVHLQRPNGGRLIGAPSPFNGHTAIHISGNNATWVDGVPISLGVASNTLQTLSINCAGDRAKAFRQLNGVKGAEVDCAAAAFSTPLALSFSTNALNADLALLAVTTGNHPELHALARQWGRLVCGAP